MPPPPAGGDLGLGGWDGRGKGGVCVGENGGGTWIWRRFGRIERSGGGWGRGRGSVAFPVDEISGVPEVAEGIIGALRSGSFGSPCFRETAGRRGIPGGEGIFISMAHGTGMGERGSGNKGVFIKNGMHERMWGTTMVAVGWKS